MLYNIIATMVPIDYTGICHVLTKHISIAINKSVSINNYTYVYSYVRTYCTYT